FKTGLSLLSTNSKKAVTEISKFASGSLQLQNKLVEEAVDDGGGHMPGIMNEVIGFFTEISVMPNCSTDFPTTFDQIPELESKTS
ncbi:hypothetical protein DVH24_036987, partial [Malus domestica]